MNNSHRFISVQFHRYKGFRDYTLKLNDFNVLVGPNNCGKSTIISAFRILSEAMRKASQYKPSGIVGPDGDCIGYSIDISKIPVALENVFYDYDDSEPATITFVLSNSNKLILYFPQIGICNLICHPITKAIRKPSDFKKAYDASIAFVPILGPVEHNESLYQFEAARLALLTHRAARNFRNIWYHYPDGFDLFRDWVSSTWPGMDIERPKVDYECKPPLLHMFCPEERIPREIFWAGFGFQVWCQLLTYIIRGKDASLFLIDEPDIYLHSDLQRQLIGILKSLEADIIMATHSTEIIAESEPGDLVLINKKKKSASRIRQHMQLQDVFKVLGSTLNPTLTQLAKTKRALFVEGKDFHILSRFARRLGEERIANRSDFAVIPAEGFNPAKVINFIEGIRTTLGEKITSAVVFDRDYRSIDECEMIVRDLNQCSFVKIHNRKEIENFLLHPDVLQRTIEERILEYNKRTGKNINSKVNCNDLLDDITKSMKSKILSLFLNNRRQFEKNKDRSISYETIDEKHIAEFESMWSMLDKRLLIIPGKEVISQLNQRLQDSYRISITPAAIIKTFTKNEIPSEMVELIDSIRCFSQSV